MYIAAHDSYSPEYNIKEEDANGLKKLESKKLTVPPHVQLRHTYPPKWLWPQHDDTKLIYIQPWEFVKVPFEWQYKFETFADALIAPSEFNRRSFIEGGLHPDNVFTIPNGYDDTIYNTKKSNLFPGIDPDKFNFVFVGNTHKRKGLDILLPAWSKCFKNDDKVQLIIKDNSDVYDETDIESHIINLQNKTKCAEIIYIDSQLSDEEMASIFKSSKAIVHPYRGEGFGMPIQEALACGCWPIIPDKGPTDEFVPPEAGTRIETRQIPIDTTHLLPPGCALSRMVSPTFINEPSSQSLQNAMKYVYLNFDKQNFYNKIKKLEMKNTWENVCLMYKDVITHIGSKEKTSRQKFR
ncbi:MAG: glycosyltransferase family 4 protein [Desulfobacteraceae bacterium]|nr:glycosyltransferase family 4 protein [Desulfobacteraceae bacterium]